MFWVTKVPCNSSVCLGSTGFEDLDSRKEDHPENLDQGSFRVKDQSLLQALGCAVGVMHTERSVEMAEKDSQTRCL